MGATYSNLCQHQKVPQICKICRVPIQETLKRTRSTDTGRRTPENSSSYFTHSWEQWFFMCDAGATALTEQAKLGELILYGDLWSAIQSRCEWDIGHPWRQIPMLLEYVSDRTYEDIGLFLPALAVESPEEGPREGFFRLAADRGALPVADAPPPGKEWTGMTKNQRDFWESQKTLIFSKFRPSP